MTRRRSVGLNQRFKILRWRSSTCSDGDANVCNSNEIAAGGANAALVRGIGQFGAYVLDLVCGVTKHLHTIICCPHGVVHLCTRTCLMVGLRHWLHLHGVVTRIRSAIQHGCRSKPLNGECQHHQPEQEGMEQPHTITNFSRTLPRLGKECQLAYLLPPPRCDWRATSSRATSSPRIVIVLPSAACMASPSFIR